MRAGRLDRRITIQRKTVTPSDSGEPVETWNTLATRWASMTPVKGDERFNDPQLVAEEQIEFRVRYSAVIADLSPLDRIIYPTQSDPPVRRIHDILAVHEIGRREGLQIITRRRPDVLTASSGVLAGSSSLTFSLTGTVAIAASLSGAGSLTFTPTVGEDAATFDSSSVTFDDTSHTWDEAA